MLKALYRFKKNAIFRNFGQRFILKFDLNSSCYALSAHTEMTLYIIASLLLTFCALCEPYSINTGTTPSKRFVGRREVISTATATVLSLPFLPSVARAEIPGIAGQSPKTILITGASSGIGFDAVSRFVSLGHTVYASARNLEKSESIKTRLSSDLPGTCITGVCDLSDLSSVTAYADRLKADGVKFDCVCLNAGLAPGISRKVSGRSETTRTRIII